MRKIINESLFEEFQEESDPIKDMGIGIIKAKIDKKYLKTLSLEELDELYNRVHHKRDANVIVNGIPFGKLSRSEQIIFNNNIVAAINIVRYQQERAKTLSRNFKEGDAVKVDFNGRWVKGYVSFTEKGEVMVDKQGRLFIDIPDGDMQVFSDNAILLTPKEKIAFDKEYNETRYNDEKERIEKQIKWFSMSGSNEDIIKSLNQKLKELADEYKIRNK